MLAFSQGLFKKDLGNFIVIVFITITACMFITENVIVAGSIIVEVLCAQRLPRNGWRSWSWKVCPNTRPAGCMRVTWRWGPRSMIFTIFVFCSQSLEEFILLGWGSHSLRKGACEGLQVHSYIWENFCSIVVAGGKMLREHDWWNFPHNLQSHCSCNACYRP